MAIVRFCFVVSAFARALPPLLPIVAKYLESSDWLMAQ